MENKERRIVYNAIKTPDGTIIESSHMHDFVKHTDLNGQRYAVDGGKSYLKRMFDKPDYEDISVYEDECTHEQLITYLKWGNNYDKNMNLLPKTVWIPIKDMTTDHIEAVIDGGFCKNPLYTSVFEKELKERK